MELIRGQGSALIPCKLLLQRSDLANVRLECRAEPAFEAPLWDLHISRDTPGKNCGNEFPIAASASIPAWHPIKLHGLVSVWRNPIAAVSGKAHHKLNIL